MKIFLRILYTLLFTLGIPVILLSLLWKSRKNPGYRDRWLERFGIFSFALKPHGIWLHAVSLGESIAAIPLIRALQKEFPDLTITMTSTTPTGSARIKSTFKNEIFHVYFPYDLPWCWALFLKKIRPQVAILMETEMWPNCLEACARHKIPVMIVNARLSPRSIQGFSRIEELTRQMLSQVTLVAAQSGMDGERFIKLGLDPARLVVTGNIKFDTTVKDEMILEAKKLREAFGTQRFVFTAASTHTGEEEIILKAFRRIKALLPGALLILVPRHPERFQDIVQLLNEKELSFAVRSKGEIPLQDTAVYLGDTMGELFLFYAASDVAFVGGSFVPVGGHNTLEPAAVGVPVIVGPHVHNFVDITKMLLEAKAMVQVQDEVTLANAVLHWSNQPTERELSGQAGKLVVERNKGAVDKVIDLIKPFISKTF